jgi:hypothetical protein
VESALQSQNTLLGSENRTAFLPAVVETQSGVSGGVAHHRQMPLYPIISVAACRRMSPHVAVCRRVSPVTGQILGQPMQSGTLVSTGRPHGSRSFRPRNSALRGVDNGHPFVHAPSNLR